MFITHSSFPSIILSREGLHEWQDAVNGLANTLKVPSVSITRHAPPFFEIVCTSSRTKIHSHLGAISPVKTSIVKQSSIRVKRSGSPTPQNPRAGKTAPPLRMKCSPTSGFRHSCQMEKYLAPSSSRIPKQTLCPMKAKSFSGNSSKSLSLIWLPSCRLPKQIRKNL
jgi:hypothetical protein